MVVAVVAPVESVAFVASVGYEKSNKFCENASLSSSFVLEYGRLSSFSFVLGFTEENILHKPVFSDFVKNRLPSIYSSTIKITNSEITGQSSLGTESSKKVYSVRAKGNAFIELNNVTLKVYVETPGATAVDDIADACEIQEDKSSTAYGVKGEITGK